MAKEEIKAVETEKKAYELAYLLVPQLADEKAVASVAGIVKHIEGLGGSLIAQDGPEARELAYTISIVHTGKRTDYDSAYFGWIRFEIQASAQAPLKEWLANNREVVRALIISVSRSVPVMSIKKATRRASASTKTEGDVEKPEMSSEEIDKQVDELIATTVAEPVV